MQYNRFIRYIYFWRCLQTLREAAKLGLPVQLLEPHLIKAVLVSTGNTSVHILGGEMSVLDHAQNARMRQDQDRTISNNTGGRSLRRVGECKGLLPT